MIPVVVGSNPIIHPSFTPVSGYIPVNGPLAQLVEQLTLNQLVEGSNPSRPTNAKQNADRLRSAFCFTRCKPMARRASGGSGYAKQFAAVGTGGTSPFGALVLQGGATVKWLAFV